MLTSALLLQERAHHDLCLSEEDVPAFGVIFGIPLTVPGVIAQSATSSASVPLRHLPVSVRSIATGGRF